MDQKYKHIGIITSVCLAVVSMPLESDAGPFEDGIAAMDSGDYQSAYQLWLPLADQGIPEAQQALGILFYNGWGVPQDKLEAVKWVRRAALRGNAKAQRSFGSAYEFGDGVPQDYSEAFKWYQLAAKQGLAEAQFNLGTLYTLGLGVAPDRAASILWNGLAAEQGHYPAQFNLSSELSNGDINDRIEAAKWFMIAEARGASPAKNELEKLTSTLSADQIVEASARAEKWLEQHPLN